MAYDGLVFVYRFKITWMDSHTFYRNSTKGSASNFLVICVICAFLEALTQFLFLNYLYVKVILAYDN